MDERVLKEGSRIYETIEGLDVGGMASDIGLRAGRIRK